MKLSLGGVGKTLLILASAGIAGFAVLKVAGTFYEPIAWLPDYLWGVGIGVYENAIQVPLSIMAAGGTLVAGFVARFAQGKRDLEASLNGVIMKKDTLLQTKDGAIEALLGEKTSLEDQLAQQRLEYENKLLASVNEGQAKVTEVQQQSASSQETSTKTINSLVATNDSQAQQIGEQAREIQSLATQLAELNKRISELTPHTFQ